MSITQFSDKRVYALLSTDVKPTTARNGDYCEEIDTSKLYQFDADSSSWIERTPRIAFTGNAYSAESSATITRPSNTTDYTAGDVIAATPTAVATFSGVSTDTGANIIILGASLEVDVNAVPSGMTGFRLHLYNASPTAIDDNSAYSLPAGDRAKYLGSIIFDTPIDIGDTLFVRMNNVNFKTKLASGSTSLYGILETRGAFKPSSGCVKKITLHSVGV